MYIKEKILIAEISSSAKKKIIKLLKILDYDYKIVDNGLAAIFALKISNYNLIILNSEMPVLNGIETFQKIKENFDAPKSEIPIVIMENKDSDSNMKNEYSKIGFDGYISKPMTLQDLGELTRGFFYSEEDE